jgi:hypothetical protein
MMIRRIVCAPAMRHNMVVLQPWSNTLQTFDSG